MTNDASQEQHRLHVIVAGAGLAGLALAQGLVRSGHTVEVFERDADLDRKQGYYLHFNPIGGEALRRVLPDDLFELYLETSRESYDRPESIVLNDQLDELTSRPHLGPPNPGPRNHTGVHRRTLRQLLSGRLGDSLHSGNAVVSFEQDADGVTVTLSDGSTARGDLLVGADGIRSAVRSQLLPEVPVIPTGIQGIGIYGRTPLTPELDEQLPSILDQGVLMAVDRKGSRLLIANFRPRRPADEAAAEIAPDVKLDAVPAYAMVSCSVAPGTEVPPTREWTARDRAGDEGARCSPRSRAGTRRPGPWSRRIEPDSMFIIPFGFLEPAESWEPSRVTIVGDAAHGMLPTLGMGANLSLNDAALLIDQLDRYAAGEVGLHEAIGAYEAAMREVTYPILRMTLDHDSNFGGGGLRRPPRRSVRSRRPREPAGGQGGPGHRHRRRHRPGDGARVRPRGRARRRLRPARGPVGRDRRAGARGRRADGRGRPGRPRHRGRRTPRGSTRRPSWPAASTCWSTTPPRSGSGPIDELSYADWSFTIRNELDIVFLVTRAAWPHLVARGGGSDRQHRLDLGHARRLVHAAERPRCGQGRRARADHRTSSSRAARTASGSTR